MVRVAKLREVLEAHPEGPAKDLARRVVRLAAKTAAAREALSDPGHVADELHAVALGLVDVAEALLGVGADRCPPAVAGDDA